MKTKILNFLFLISVHLVCAQISGTIIELDDSLPLEYATAALFHENDLLQFEILIDIIAVDYSDFGISEWNAKNANNKGYSRGITKDSSGRYTYETSKKNHNQPKKRFAAIYNLLSVTSNFRLNVKFYCNEDDAPSLQ